MLFRVAGYDVAIIPDGDVATDEGIVEPIPGVTLDVTGMRVRRYRRRGHARRRPRENSAGVLDHRAGLGTQIARFDRTSAAVRGEQLTALTAGLSGR
ncbi:MAG: hypothetical protein ACRCSN_03540 [Dermatophilaceae bacterium]